MAPHDRWLLPSGAELASLSDEKVKAIISLADNEGKRYNSYSIVGMVCGTASFPGCLGCYVFLVNRGYDTAAAVVLGTTVLAIIGRMIRGR